jgi:pimeloyl-ACP methyl ester carboxylesterase
MTAVETFKTEQGRLLRRHGVDASSHFVDVAAVDGPVHVLRCGAGPPVVLVPGFADPAAIWASLIGRLDGFTRYAVDRPCFGLSGCAIHSTATIRGLAVDFLSQVFDALGLDRPAVIGNSIGSLWSTWLALDRPERVASLIHVGCPAFWLGTSAPLPLRLLSVPPIGRALMAASPPSARQVEAFGRRSAGEVLSQAPELRDLLVAAQHLPGAQQATLSLLHTVVRLRGARPEVALTADALAAISQPVLLVWGARDAFGGPDVAAEAARVIPDVTLHLVPDAGHVPWVGHASEVTAAIVPFLHRHGVH